MKTDSTNGVLYLNKPKMALDFLVEILGFVIERNTVSLDPEHPLVCDWQGNHYEIVPNAAEDRNIDRHLKAVLNSTDCLRSYHDMIVKGVGICSNPHYLPEGLAFEIYDYCGNIYTFLERKNCAA